MVDFEQISVNGHEQVVFFSDPSCSLRAIVAIHDTTLGPALGGTRMWNYASTQEAMTDVLRLSKGMSYKAAISGLNFGGGKAVIMGDPRCDKSETLFRSYGRFIETLNGRYITAKDVNMDAEDIGYIFCETDYVTGVSLSHGGSGNPSPYTARGVFRGMEAACVEVFGDRSLKDKTVALQGVGSVGFLLGEWLSKGGAKVFFTDIDEDLRFSFERACPHSEFISPDDITSLDCDIYAPCALGATINDETVESLKCRIVAGAANNQLHTQNHGEILAKRGILYAPDYLINAGGLMNVSIEFDGWTEDKAIKMVDGIYKKTRDLFKTARQENCSPAKIIDHLAEARIASLKKIRGKFLGRHAAPRIGRPGRR